MYLTDAPACLPLLGALAPHGQTFTRRDASRGGAFLLCAALVWSKVFRRAACCNGQMLMTFGRRRAAGGRRKWPQRGSPSSPPPVVFELFSGCVVWRRRVPALSAELYRETTDE